MKNNIKIILAFIIGVIVSGASVYALTVASKDITYDNTNSGSDATTVQEAVDELYTKVSSLKDLNIQTTATASDILSGKTAYDTEGNLITGTYTIPSTYKNLTTQTTATASHILSGKTAYNTDGSLITGTYTAPSVTSINSFAERTNSSRGKTAGSMTYGLENNVLYLIMYTFTSVAGDVGWSGAGSISVSGAKSYKVINLGQNNTNGSAYHAHMLVMAIGNGGNCTVSSTSKTNFAGDYHWYVYRIGTNMNP